jgi:hypothetical protein
MNVQRVKTRPAVGGEAIDLQAVVSLTVDGSIDGAMNVWLALVRGRTTFDGSAMSGKPVRTKAPRWRCWRVALDDGSRISAVAGLKKPGKVLLGVVPDKLADSLEVLRWKAYWETFLARARPPAPQVRASGS